jgi:hypothetical protein
MLSGVEARKGEKRGITKCVFEEVIFIPTAIGISLRKSRRQRLQQMVYIQPFSL